jgi:hypothetical protein
MLDFGSLSQRNADPDRLSRRTASPSAVASMAPSSPPASSGITGAARIVRIVALCQALHISLNGKEAVTAAHRTVLH